MTAPENWSVEEADAALPRITRIIEDVRATLAGTRDHARTAAATASGNGHSSSRAAALTFQEAVERLAAEGIVLRDADRGLVDFPSISSDGRPYWLCWVLGEPSVAWWHWPQDGFLGRQPLDRRPDRT